MNDPKQIHISEFIYGCPAEELLTGKPWMAKAGAFKECDFTFAWHPGSSNQTTVGTFTALEGAKFIFHGRTAHAAGLLNVHFFLNHRQTHAAKSKFFQKITLVFLKLLYEDI